jgi:hypothetical protein
MRLGFERTVADLTQPVETDGAGQVVAQFALVEDGGYRNRPSTMKLSHHWPCDDGAKCYGSTQAGRPSPMPKAWRIGSSTMAGVTLGVCLLAFCSGVLAVGNFRMNLGTDAVAMTPLPVALVAGTLAAAVIFAFILDLVKVPVFARLGIAQTPVTQITASITRPKRVPTTKSMRPTRAVGQKGRG